jgi:hypothetical protein
MPLHSAAAPVLRADLPITSNAGCERHRLRRRYITMLFPSYWIRLLVRGGHGFMIPKTPLRPCIHSHMRLGL